MSLGPCCRCTRARKSQVELVQVVTRLCCLYQSGTCTLGESVRWRTGRVRWRTPSEGPRETKLKDIFRHFFVMFVLLTALTLGGSRDTEMATPTKLASFPLKSEIAPAQPEGNATRVPTQMTRSRPRSRIMSVGQAQFSACSAQCSVKLSVIKPKKYPRLV